MKRKKVALALKTHQKIYKSSGDVLYMNEFLLGIDKMLNMQLDLGKQFSMVTYLILCCYLCLLKGELCERQL